MGRSLRARLHGMANGTSSRRLVEYEGMYEDRC